MQHFESKAIRLQTKRSINKEHSNPVYLTSSFVFDSAEEMAEAFDEKIEHHVYSRYSNPNTKELIEKMCALENTEAGFATSSGMAAIFSTFATFCSTGDHIISIRSVFGSTHTLFTKILPKWQISTTYVGVNNTLEWEKALTPKTKLFYIETPTNPGLEIVDLEQIGEFCKKHALLLVVDNCFATPYLQNPANYGADIVIHSATKYLDGQGRVLGGLVLGKKELIKEVYLFSRITGPALSPFNAWTLSKSVETLAVRMDRHAENALYIAEKLQGHEKIKTINYPFLPTHKSYAIAKKQMRNGGGIITIDLVGDYSSAITFINNCSAFSISANLGDTRTIVTHPASSTHAKLSEEERLAVNITKGLVRISIGLENKEDILKELLKALSAIPK